MNKLKVKQLQFFVKDNWIILVTLFVFFMMILLVNYSFSALSLARIEEANLKEETKILKNRVDIIKTNSQLKADQIRIYNQVLSTLIPDNEDTFTIIYALEKIGAETGFVISNYTVNVSATTQNKISLVVGGKGNINTFMEFLKNYNYIGGRLATSETIQFSGTNVDTQVNLNFYNKKYVVDQEIVPQLSSQDLDMLQKIKEKIKINFVTPESEVNSDYEITNNPFE